MKIYGDDLETLEATADRIQEIVTGTAGSADVQREQVTGLPILSIRPDRDALARYGLNVGDIQAVAATALGGQVAGRFFEGDRRAVHSPRGAPPPVPATEEEREAQR